MAGPGRGKPSKAASAGTDKATNTIASNGPIGSFFDGRKSDWNKVRNLGQVFQDNGKDIGKTADAFLTDFGGGSFGKGAAKLGGYALGGAMLYDMLFD